jgi:HD-GYP domain-containing protein (c-di-GMP phosphodiesterase class II)
MDPDAALEHLRHDAGAAFDPRVFEALRAVVKSGKTAH